MAPTSLAIPTASPTRARCPRWRAPGDSVAALKYPGDLLGELALFYGGLRSADLVTTSGDERLPGYVRDPCDPNRLPGDGRDPCDPNRLPGDGRDPCDPNRVPGV
eukprot:324570-Prymnesium_polylepis.1